MNRWLTHHSSCVSWTTAESRTGWCHGDWCWRRDVESLWDGEFGTSRRDFAFTAYHRWMSVRARSLGSVRLTDVGGVGSLTCGFLRKWLRLSSVLVLIRNLRLLVWVLWHIID